MLITKAEKKIEDRFGGPVERPARPQVPTEDRDLGGRSTGGVVALTVVAVVIALVILYNVAVSTGMIVVVR